MFRIKICGITSVADAILAAQAGADAIGLNFFSGSARFVTVETARQIAASMPDGTTKVGVFVNEELATLRETAKIVGLDAIQLHGDEPPSLLSQLAPWPVIRAIRCRDSGLEPLVDCLEQCRLAGRLPQALLLDAYSPQEYGGTGKCLDWPAARNAVDRFGGLPVVLAGGLTAENVGEAIATARPAAVDTASGVESAPGTKDAGKMRRFVTAAKAAFEMTGLPPPQPPTEN